ncbi:MAG: DUF1513 domain-containing protein [Burkholderiaceae bacterium]
MAIDPGRRRWSLALSMAGLAPRLTAGLAAGLWAGPGRGHAAGAALDASGVASIGDHGHTDGIGDLGYTDGRGGVGGTRLLTSWGETVQHPERFLAGCLAAPGQAIVLPARGHDLDWHPDDDGSAVVVARRPGDFLIRWDVARGKVLAHHECEDTTRFEGHFAFSADRELIYATETDLITGDGVIGIFDSRSLVRLDAWPCGGIGPHALAVLADGRLAVAVGGILTLPETGRVKRNLASMDPSLTLLDPRSGRLRSQYRLPDPFMSVRHIAEAADGTLAVALQNEGRDPRPLLALLDGERLRYGDADDDLLARCGGYAGDITAFAGGFAVSCTRAGVMALWSRDGQPLGSFETPRVCALAAHGARMVATGDAGDLWQIATAAGQQTGLIAGRPAVSVAGHRSLSVALDNHSRLPRSWPQIGPSSERVFSHRRPMAVRR